MTDRTETLARLLRGVAQRCGDRTALVCEGEELTFADLEERSARLAGGLARLGVGKGDKVAVWLPSSFAWAELEFALARVGAVAVAINTMFRTHEVQDILSRSGAGTLVLQPGFKDIAFLEMVAELDFEQLPDLESLVSVGDRGDEEALQDGPPSQLRVVRYGDLLSAEPVEDLGEPGLPCNAFTSSGTTSAPKLILHSQNGICKHARAVAEAFPLARDPGAVALGMLPFCGVFGFNTVMGALAAGRTTVLMPVFDADEAVRLIEAHGVTYTNGSDEMLRRLLAAADPPSRIASLREAGFANFGADPR
ncbi:MAG: AMP-binding protein, partial [Rubrobacter sp.]